MEATVIESHSLGFQGRSPWLSLDSARKMIRHLIVGAFAFAKRANDSTERSGFWIVHRRALYSDPNLRSILSTKAKGEYVAVAMLLGFEQLLGGSSIAVKDVGERRLPHQFANSI